MTTMRATSPVDALAELVASPPDGTQASRWRWSVRSQMSGVRELLEHDAFLPENGGLAPRHCAALRERATLLRRLSALGPQVLESPDVDAVRLELMRLLGDVRHHLQRRRDLAWDDVQQELGGSE